MPRGIAKPLFLLTLVLPATALLASFGYAAWLAYSAHARSGPTAGWYPRWRSGSTDPDGSYPGMEEIRRRRNGEHLEPARSP
jgi:hypothetical protein